MNILEKVARAILLRRTRPDFHTVVKETWIVDHDRELATAAITAFLEAAAEEGWHMRPDEATKEMQKGVFGMGHYPAKLYRLMLAAAPKFELGKKTSAKPGKPPSGRI